MSICNTACETVTRSAQYSVSCLAKRRVLKSCIKRSDSTAGARNESGSAFQTVGPATEEARVPKLLRRNRGIFSLRRRCWRPEISETGTHLMERYLRARHGRRRCDSYCYPANHSRITFRNLFCAVIDNTVIFNPRVKLSLHTVS